MKGKVLLGWLTRDEAVRYLQQDCIFKPPLTDQEAEGLWAHKKEIVNALEPRAAPSPPKLDLTNEEKEGARKFLQFMRKQPGGSKQILDVVKLDPRALVVHQLDVNLDRVNQYGKSVNTATWCVKNCLAVDRTNAQVTVTVVQNGWNITVPHGEFMVGFDGQSFGIIQGAGHVSVSNVRDRVVLWAGYHRSYARAVNPDAMERTVLAALTTEGFDAIPMNSVLRERFLGDRPALLGDFFDERLFMAVQLHRKRYELRVRVDRAQVNAD